MEGFSEAMVTPTLPPQAVVLGESTLQITEEQRQ